MRIQQSKMYDNTPTPHHADSTGWDTSHVTTVEKMFNDAKSFNRDLDHWDLSSVSTLSFMFKKKKRRPAGGAF